MVSNYIKLAWRILSRRKFFTFITLFGISFTLMGLMLFISYLQYELGTQDGLTHRDKLLYTHQIKFTKQYFDTLMVRDTSYEAGVMKVDSTEDIVSGGNGINQSGISRSLLEKYLPQVKGVEQFSINSSGSDFDIYFENRKVKAEIVYTDPAFWQIFDVRFLEGNPWTKADFDNTSQVAVISDEFSNSYFGKIQDVVGQSFSIDEKTFKVVGIYRKGRVRAPFLSASALIPYTNFPKLSNETDYFGPFGATMMADASTSIYDLRKNLEFVYKSIPFGKVDDHHEYDKLQLSNATFNEGFAQNLVYEDDPTKSLQKLTWILVTLLLFFILLPTLNLINLNVSRIMDRSSEIGVRKAFGAEPKHILMQFVFENILQSVLGGIIGLGLALIVIQMLNESKILGEVYLMVNGQFFVLSFIASLLFGIISGLIPAYKMSKLEIVNALKFKSL